MPDMKNHPLGEAARYNDAECEEHGFRETIERQGLDVDDLMYLAEQRGLRSVLVASGRVAEMMALTTRADESAVALSASERRLLLVAKGAALDGILIGWRGRELADKG